MFMGVYATANDFNVMPIWILLGGYSLTLLDTSQRIVEPLGGLAPIELAPVRRRRRTAPRARTRMSKGVPRVAIVHDYLTQRGGAERVVLALAAAFPGAPIHTSFYAPAETFPEFAALDVRADVDQPGRDVCAITTVSRCRCSRPRSRACRSRPMS